MEILTAALTPLRTWLEDESVSEIMVNGPRLWIERAGRLEEVPEGISPRSMSNVIVTLARAIQREVAEEAGPRALLDARMEGFRIGAVLPPVAMHGPILAIRRHAKRQIPLESFFPQGGSAVPAPVEEGQGGEIETVDDPIRFLGELLARPVNVLVSGGTSTGKTSFLNSIVQSIPKAERVVTLEDTGEVQITAPNWAALEAHPDNGLTLAHLVKMALRLRPDRIIVGEVRGAEAFDLMQALNTGHSGAATIHANTAREALSRLETLVLSSRVGWPLEAIRRQIATTFDYVVQLSRLGGKRHVSEIIGLRGYELGGDYQYEVLWSRRRDMDRVAASPKPHREDVSHA